MWFFWQLNQSVAQSRSKSVGPDGKITYSNHPPAEGCNKKTLTFENLLSSKVPATAPNTKPMQQQTITPVVAPTSGVVLYQATWCGYCKKAKAYLASKSIAYREIDIDTNDGKSAFDQVSGGQRVQGLSQEACDEFFAGR
jgi:hypothetical protein